MCQQRCTPVTWRWGWLLLDYCTYHTHSFKHTHTSEPLFVSSNTFFTSSNVSNCVYVAKERWFTELQETEFLLQWTSTTQSESVCLVHSHLMCHIFIFICVQDAPTVVHIGNLCSLSVFYVFPQKEETWEPAGWWEALRPEATQRLHAFHEGAEAVRSGHPQIHWLCHCQHDHWKEGMCLCSVGLRLSVTQTSSDSVWDHTSKTSSNFNLDSKFYFCAWFVTYFHFTREQI